MNDRIKIGLAFFGIYIVWGTTFLAISFALKGFPPFILSGLRFSIAGILLFAYAVLIGGKVWKLADWKKSGMVGLLVLTGGTGLLTWGEQYVSSTEACTIEAAGPLLFIAADRKNWSFYFSNKTIIAGLLTGFAGVILFLSGSLLSSATGQAELKTGGIFAIIIATCCWVSGSLLVKKDHAQKDVSIPIAQQLIVAGASCLFISVIRNEPDEISIVDIPAIAWFSLVYSVLLGSIVAYFSYQYLLTVMKPAIVSTHTYINPVVALLAGTLLAGEKISTIQGIGLLVILGGVFLTNINGLFSKKPEWYKTGRLFRWIKKQKRRDMATRRSFIKQRL